MAIAYRLGLLKLLFAISIWEAQHIVHQNVSKSIYVLRSYSKRNLEQFLRHLIQCCNSLGAYAALSRLARFTLHQA